MDPTATPTPTSTPTSTPVWFTPTPYTIGTNDSGLDLDVASTDFYTIAEHGVQTYQTANNEGQIDLMMWVPIMLICFVGFKNIRKRIKDL